MAVKKLNEKTTVEVVREDELRTLLKLQDQLKKVKQLAKELEERTSGMEADLITRINSGAIVLGALAAEVKSVAGQCRPQWKEEYLKHMVTHGQSVESAEAEVRGRTIIPSKDVLVIAGK